MLKVLESIPVLPLGIVAIMLGLAPMAPEPHLVEKLRMLSEGSLVKPIDIFDLIMHSTGLLILAIKLGRMAWLSTNNDSSAG